MRGSAVAPWNQPTIPLRPSDHPVAALVDSLWREHFADIPRVNQLVAGYAFPWKRHLGRIRMTLDQQTTQIDLNGLLDHPDVPEAVPIAIVAHEIVHYAQGFGSPLERAHHHAHAHGCVDRELARRGLLRYELALQRWLGESWGTFEPLARQAWRLRRTASARTPCAIPIHVLY